MNKQKILLTLIIAIFTLASCSSVESRKQASGGYDYIEKDLTEELKIPEGLDPPPVDARYALPQLESDSNLVGDKLEIVSPRLVIPMATGSHVEEGSTEAKVLFDQIDDSKSLNQAIWDTVLAYLEFNSIGVKEFDQTNNRLITDWVIDRQEVESKWYQFSDSFIEHTKQFELTLDMAPHGRTAALTSRMTEYLDESGNSVIQQMSSQQKRRDEVNFLNFIIAEYDYGIRLERNERIAKIKQGVASEMGFNKDNEPAFIVKAPFSDAWLRIQLVLREMGFTVVDLDQSAGLIFANYEGSSWFGGLFGGSGLSLDKGEYRFVVEQAGRNTVLTFRNIDDTPFTMQEVTDIYPDFSETMADDSLEF